MESQDSRTEGIATGFKDGNQAAAEQAAAKAFCSQDGALADSATAMVEFDQDAGGMVRHTVLTDRGLLIPSPRR